MSYILSVVYSIYNIYLLAIYDFGRCLKSFFLMRTYPCGGNISRTTEVVAGVKMVGSGGGVPRTTV